MENLEDILVGVLVPISICVVLPIGIVWLIINSKIKKNENLTKLRMKALELNQFDDIDKIMGDMGETHKPTTERDIRNLRLLRGLIFFLCGIAILLCAILFNEKGDDSYTFFTLGGTIGIAIGISYIVVYFVSRPTDRD